MAFVILIILGGSLGGIIRGLSRTQDLILTLPNGTKVDLGFLGDMLIGVGASFGVLIFMTPILELDFDKDITNKIMIKLISVSIIAGYAGIALLSQLSSRLVRQLQEEMSENIEEIESERNSDVYAEEAKKIANELKNKKKKDEDFHEALNAAFGLVNHALSINEKNLKAISTKGNLLKLADKVDEALIQANKILHINPKSETGYYNRACYKCLLGNYPLSDVLADLAAAIKLLPVNKYWAQQDDDFSRIKPDPKFRKLVGLE